MLRLAVRCCGKILVLGVSSSDRGGRRAAIGRNRAAVEEAEDFGLKLLLGGGGCSCSGCSRGEHLAALERLGAWLCLQRGTRGRPEWLAGNRAWKTEGGGIWLKVPPMGGRLSSPGKNNNHINHTVQRLLHQFPKGGTSWYGLSPKDSLVPQRTI